MRHSAPMSYCIVCCGHQFYGGPHKYMTLIVTRSLEVSTECHNSHAEPGPLHHLEIYLAIPNFTAKRKLKICLWSRGLVCIRGSRGNNPASDFPPADFLVKLVCNSPLHWDPFYKQILTNISTRITNYVQIFCWINYSPTPQRQRRFRQTACEVGSWMLCYIPLKSMAVIT